MARVSITAITAAAVWVAAAAARAQAPVNLTPEDFGFEDPWRLRNVPGAPRAALPDTIEAVSLPCQTAPGDFLLLTSQSNRFGPFAYRQGVSVGAPQAPGVLQVHSATNFSLLDPRQQVTLGPFAYRTGTAFTLARVTYAVARLPPQVVITMAHPGALTRPPSLAAAPLTPATVQAVGRLRATLAALYDRLSSDTAPRMFQGRPQVDGAFGLPGSATVKRSARDRENARRQAALSAVLALERFQRESLPFKATAGPGGVCRFAALPPGNYVFCALWQVKDPAAVTAGLAATAVWWTTFTLQAHDKLLLDLNAQNATDWAGIFKFSRFE